MAKAKQPRKRDFLWAAIAVVAVLAVVVIAAHAVEGSRSRPKVDLGDITTGATSSEPAATTAATEETTVSETEPTAPPTVTVTEETTEPPVTEAPETTVTEAPATEAKVTESKPSTTAEPAKDLVMPEDTGAPAEARPVAVTTKATEAAEEVIDDDYSETGYNHNIKNIVLLGVDKQELGENSLFRTGGQSDVMLILSLNLKTKEYFILYVNRDLAVPVENYSSVGYSYGFVDEQICLAYAYGDGSRLSGRNALQSLHALLGDELSFEGFIAAPIPIVSILADAVGGVEVTIKDNFEGVEDDFKMGETVLLKGAQAETFIRSRMWMPDDDHNSARMTRQIDFMTSFVKKAKETLTADEAVDLFNDLMDMTVTDMSASEITKWILTGYDYQFKGFYRIDGTEGERKHNARCTYPDYDEVNELVHELYYK